jgi:hypothetical protein
VKEKGFPAGCEERTQNKGPDGLTGAVVLHLPSTDVAAERDAPASS